jgi:peptidoglycan/xylan/chitin deacetylase (PgdA/CDA1 family)
LRGSEPLPVSRLSPITSRERPVKLFESLSRTFRPSREVASKLRNRAGRIGPRPLRRFRQRAAILVYHRVARLPTDPQALCVSPDHFAEQLAVIASGYSAIPLRELGQRIERGALQTRTVVVTFDDGYADNLHAAKPLLEAAGVPATVFAATGHVASGREYWWDEAERLLLLSHPKHEELRLNVCGSVRRWILSDAVAKQRAYEDMVRALRPCPNEEIASVLGQLRAWVGEEASPPARETYRPLTPDELRLLACGGLVEIGAHTRHHPSLRFQSQDVQRREIEGSKRDLTTWLGEPPRSFSYPFGVRGIDYGRLTKKLVKAAGFTLAVGNYAGPTTRASDLCGLPRNLVRDWDVGEFEQRLQKAFE